MEAIGISVKGSLWSGAKGVAVAFRAAKIYSTFLILSMATTACSPEPGSLAAMADATRQPRAEVAAAVAVSPDDRLALASANLVEILDATFAQIGPQ